MREVLTFRGLVLDSGPEVWNCHLALCDQRILLHLDLTHWGRKGGGRGGGKG